ncbi:ABC transporter ATP-binding protein [Sandaracinus amylolyticus]|uniref:Iron(III) dicitrate transport ATP-binding protein FecE n=1 Tax=Sandaracinus amylolyticus TaxID=927083 RepID=A0A0F6YH19_9BACT|nr:ABC transporter ATP-binding protein [Sandaracinus amylolyticus]AKF04322.1 Iron(III) dicitrate transport ATP-binding protein FecE [Sandaracinus amylolyticus]
MISCRGLEVRYGARRVLAGIDLELAPGELVALIGPNAVGKSTLVRALAGVLRPSAGEVLVRAPRARTVAYVGQSEPLPAEFTVHDVVGLGRLPHHGVLGAAHGERDRAAIARALEATGTSALAFRRIGELSGGEQQRVALARALAQEAHVLLLDEALAHLDVRHRRDVLGTLRRESARGTAALCVVHELALATYVDRCVLLHAGAGGARIAADGAPRDVLRADRLEDVYGVPFDVELRDGRARVAARMEWEETR